MPRAWISIGSNQDREASVRLAVRELRRRYGRLVLSPVYETPAEGFVGEPFWNLVAGIDSDLPVAELHRQLREIEDLAGRQRGAEKFSDRTLDLDLLTYGNQVGDEGGKRLPRADILDYDFVLVPLVDVAAAEHHPELGESYRQLWLARGARRLHQVELPGL